MELRSRSSFKQRLAATWRRHPLRCTLLAIPCVMAVFGGFSTPGFFAGVAAAGSRYRRMWQAVAAVTSIAPPVAIHFASKEVGVSGAWALIFVWMLLGVPFALPLAFPRIPKG